MVQVRLLLFEPSWGPFRVESSKPVARLSQADVACDSAAFAELSVAILSLGKSLRFRARGYSMHPLVRDGDLLLVRPVSARAVYRGDLVLCRNARGEMIVHRMVRRLGQGDSLRFELRGDRLAGPDEAVPAPEIFGRVSSVERDGVRIDIRQPAMRLLGFGIAVLGPERIRSIPGLRALVQRAPALSRYLMA